ncbi:MAG: cytochrome c oxidase assembly protein, partial [Actinomycetota bacterium]|nr:cytochrome c oxidase assembly protein [Actinomycetota bacterium]
VSPLDALADALFSAHMVQHVVLVLLAAPLLVVGEPLRVMPWALLPRHRVALLRLHRGMGSLESPAWPAAGLVAYVGVTWMWHLPGLYQAGVTNPLVHIVMHATMLGAALFFWWSLAGDAKRQRAGVGVVVLFLATLQNAALSVHMALLPLPLYPVYDDTTAAWGLTLLQDQQVAGMLMWVPGTIVYLVAGAALFVAWLRADEHANLAQARRGRARGSASPVTSRGGS